MRSVWHNADLAEQRQSHHILCMLICVVRAFGRAVYITDARILFEFRVLYLIFIGRCVFPRLAAWLFASCAATGFESRTYFEVAPTSTTYPSHAAPLPDCTVGRRVSRKCACLPEQNLSDIDKLFADCVSRVPAAGWSSSWTKLKDVLSREIKIERRLVAYRIRLACAQLCHLIL